MSAKKHHTIIVAHPDDETLFFGGLILQNPEVHWNIVCVTDGNADGQGHVRQQQFQQACHLMGATDSQCLGLPDEFEVRLDLKKLSEALVELPPTDQIYTHGPLGEYGHPHHQDVSYAVHKTFPDIPILAVAYNCYPTKVVQLDQTAYGTKLEVLKEIYFAEMERLLHLLPCIFVEGFTQFSWNEVSELYQYLNQNKDLNSTNLQHYREFAKLLPSYRAKTQVRPF